MSNLCLSLFLAAIFSLSAVGAQAATSSSAPREAGSTLVIAQTQGMERRDDRRDDRQDNRGGRQDDRQDRRGGGNDEDEKEKEKEAEDK